MALRIVVDRLRCIGAGNCVDAAPGVFQLDEKDISIIINPFGAPPDTIVTAAESCPRCQRRRCLARPGRRWVFHLQKTQRFLK